MMNEEEITEVAREAIMLTIELSTPTLMFGLVVNTIILWKLKHFIGK